MMADDYRAIDIAYESLQLAEGLGLDAVRSRNLNTIGCGKVKRGDRSGLEDLELAIEIGAAANSHEEVSALANLQTMVGILGDLRRAAGLQEQSLIVARRLGVTSFVRWQEAEGAIQAFWQGRWAEAFAQSNDFIEASEAGSSHYMDSVCRYVRGSIYLARGEIEAALADARRGTEQARPVKDPQALNPAVAFEARLELAAGNLEAAGRLADELLAIWGGDGVGPQVESIDGAWALVDLGRADELVAAIERAEAQTVWHDGARHIAAGDAAAAAEVYAQIGTLPDELYARLRAADDLVRRGRRADADAQLRLALPRFSELGATAWQAQAEALLAASA